MGPCGCCPVGPSLSQPRGAARAAKVKLLCVNNTCSAGGAGDPHLDVSHCGGCRQFGCAGCNHVYKYLYKCVYKCCSAFRISSLLPWSVFVGWSKSNTPPPPCDCSCPEECAFCCSSEPCSEWALSAQTRQGCSGSFIPSAYFGETGQL